MHALTRWKLEWGPLHEHEPSCSAVNLLLSAINEFIDQSFTMVEREMVYEAKHVVACNDKEMRENTITFAGLVLQPSAVNKDPHELEVAVKERELIAATCNRW